MIPKLSKPQQVALNAAVAGVLAALVAWPSWQLVVALVALLGALCFRWTRETETKQHIEVDERIAELNGRLKLQEHGLGKLKFKIGIKGD